MSSGYLDDLILVLLGIILVLRMIPAVLTECRLQAETAIAQDKPTSLIAVAIVVAIWFLQNPTFLTPQSYPIACQKQTLSSINTP